MQESRPINISDKPNFLIHLALTNKLLTAHPICMIISVSRQKKTGGWVPSKKKIEYLE